MKWSMKEQVYRINDIIRRLGNRHCPSQRSKHLLVTYLSQSYYGSTYGFHLASLDILQFQCKCDKDGIIPCAQRTFKEV